MFEGEEAVRHGLVDEIGNLSGVLASQYPECKVKVVEEPEIKKRMRMLRAWV